MITTTEFDSTAFLPLTRDGEHCVGVGSAIVDPRFPLVPRSTLDLIQHNLAVLPEFPHHEELARALEKTWETSHEVTWDCPTVTDAQQDIMDSLNTYVAWELVSHRLAQGDVELWAPRLGITLNCHHGTIDAILLGNSSTGDEEFSGHETQIAVDLRKHVDSMGPQAVAGIKGNSRLLTALLGTRPVKDASTVELFERMRAKAHRFTEALLMYRDHFLPGAQDSEHPAPVRISAIGSAEAVYVVDSLATFTVQDGTCALLHGAV